MFLGGNFMLHLRLSFLLFFLFLSILDARVVYEDAEDGNIDGWFVRDANPDGATIVNVYDEDKDSQVIEFRGTGTRNSYMLGANHGEGAWDNRVDRAIRWRMNFAGDFVFYVSVQTRLGHRYLFYTPSINRGLLHGFPGGIHHGLGRANGWRTITRDLDRDLKDAEPYNDIISVNGLIVRGNGRVDDIMLYTPTYRVYEDGESGTDGWQVSDNDPSEATIRSVPDNDLQGNNRQGYVISLQGAGFENAYRLGDIAGQNAWNNRTESILQWRFRDFGPPVELLEERGTIRDRNAFLFTVFVDTTEGHREIEYSLGNDRGLNGSTIHHGLGDDRIRGSVWIGDDPQSDLGLWQTITRDIEEDIREYEPDNRLIAINGFQVRGSGLIDDIKTLSRDEVDFEPLEILSVQPEDITKTTVNIRAVVSDFCQLQIEYGETTEYGNWTKQENSFRWSTHLQRIRDLQPNTTYHYRVHVWDRQGREVVSDDMTFRTLGNGNIITVEDAEDGNVDGWSIYDNTPSGATITNVEDETKGDRVIELSGDRYNNGYMLGGRNSTSGWNNTTHQQLRWSMNYSEGFVIYVPVDTTNGQRYLLYSPHDTDRGISGQYIRLGLGKGANNGTWQTFTRNIAADLKRFEPDNELVSINGFMVRGSGRIDDIALISE